MEDKAKFILIGLIVAGTALIVSLFVNFQSCSANRALQQDKELLKTENTTLSKKVEETIKAKKDLEAKVASLNEEIAQIAKQREEIEKKSQEVEKQYNSVAKERDELAQKIKEQARRPVSIEEDAYWAKVLKEKTDLALRLESLTNDLNSSKIDNEQLQKDKGALELDLSNLTRERQDLEQQLKTLDSMSFELVRERNTSLQLQNNLAAVKNENAILKRQLKNLSYYKVNLEKKLKQVQESKVSLERQFNEMGMLLETRLSQINDLKVQLDAVRTGIGASLEQPMRKESVELPPIIVNPQTQTFPSTEVKRMGGTGKVLSVNKDNNFVVIDLGSNSGLKVGDKKQVFRSGELVGSVEIIQTRDEISACDIIKETLPIRVGDVIR